MAPFVAALMASLIEDIRLLEAFVMAPLGLHSDIRMLRESIPVPEAGDLSQELAQKRRLGYRNLTKDPAGSALQTAEHVGSSLAILESLVEGSGVPVTAEWLERARKVVARAEQKMAGDLRAKLVDRLRGLCVILDAPGTAGRPESEVAEAALRGGATVIQLRDKSRDGREVLHIARQLKGKCDEHGALFIMNGDPAVALACDADGLHLGQADLPVHDARRVLRHGQILGRSNGNLAQVARSQADGVDYLAVGPVFPTTAVGRNERAVVGVDIVGDVKRTASQPVVVTGGISHENVGEVVLAGADCVGVGSAVTIAADPEAAARAGGGDTGRLRLSHVTTDICPEPSVGEDI